MVASGRRVGTLTGPVGVGGDLPRVRGVLDDEGVDHVVVEQRSDTGRSHRRVRRRASLQRCRDRPTFDGGTWPVVAGRLDAWLSTLDSPFLAVLAVVALVSLAVSAGVRYLLASGLL